MATLTRSSRVKELNEMSDAAVAHGEASDAQRKAAEREAKKAEVRRRLEEAGSKGKKAKKGFLTPERKKKLRKLLMVKAAEDLKRQQLEKEKDRQRILSERTIALPEVESIDDKTKLEAIFKDLEARVFQLESEKWDINRAVGQRDSDINALTIDVNDLRGKYVKPALKKVSKYDNKFKRVGSAAQGEKQDFRASLKVVKKDVMDEIMNAKKEEDKPDWSKKNREEKEEAKEAKEEPKQVEAELAQNEEELATENNEEEQGEEEEEEIEEDEE